MGVMLEGILFRTILWIIIRGLFLIWNKKYKDISPQRELLFNTFIFYCISVITVTLPIDFGGLPGGHHLGINIIPFMDMVRDFQHNTFFSLSFRLRFLFRNLIGNILLLLPLGLFLPILWSKFRDFGKTVFMGVVVSLAIELSQLFLSYLSLGSRSTDIDDLILNTLGIVIGYIIYDKILVRFNCFSQLTKDI
jgi:glycopeptide antibiotics resistance protein